MPESIGPEVRKSDELFMYRLQGETDANEKAT